MEPRVVDSVNELTRRWVATLPGDDWVVSGLGAWASLAPALAGASGQALREMEGVLAVGRDEAGTAVRALHATVAESVGISMAAGIWMRRGLSPNRSYVDSVAPTAVDIIPDDPAELDRWVHDATGGVIGRFPIEVAPDSLMVLASAVAAAGPWAQPFSEGVGRWLHQVRYDVDSAAILRTAHTSVVRVVCQTRAGFDVHLVVGPEGEPPGVVLGAGLEALAGRIEMLAGSALRKRDSGGCLTVTSERRPDQRGPLLALSTPAFDISSDHDLLARHELFGLSAARDAARGHFPGIATAELAIQSAAQSALSRFSATGFEAASATAIGLQAASAPARLRKVRVVRVVLDRPFGFLVVQPTSGLVCFAGWVAVIPPSESSNADTGMVGEAARR